jgi:hypothetical protein
LAGFDRPVIPSKSVTNIPFSFVAPLEPGGLEKVVMFRADGFRKVAWFAKVKTEVFADFWSSPRTLRFVASSVKGSSEEDSVENTKNIQVTSYQSLPVLSVFSDLPFLHCDVTSQQGGVVRVAVTMDATFNFVDNKDVTGNIILKYGDEKDLQFLIPVTISLQKCCRVITGDMQLNYFKKNREPLLRRVAMLANGRLLPSDLVVHAIPDWLAITNVEHDGQYAYLTLEYSIDRLPSSWQGALFEVSASGQFSTVICRGAVYRED